MRRRIGVSGAVVAAGVLLVASACARPVEAQPAPSASDPVCAQVLQALPDDLGGEQRRSTTSQASRAWGDPAIVLRCGVDPLPPTDEQCVAVTAPDGTEIGWVVAESESGSQFTTYGLLPAVEVTVPSAYAGDQSILLEITEALSLLAQDGDRECL